MSDLNRRQFVILTGAACGCCALGLQPSGSSTALADDAPSTVDAGPAAKYSADGIVSDFAAKGKFYLITTNGQLVALSGICTHRGCTIKPGGDGFKCPCHGATYALDGKTIRQKGDNSDLPRLSISINKDGNVIVDPSKTFDREDWDKNPTSVAVPAVATK